MNTLGLKFDLESPAGEPTGIWTTTAALSVRVDGETVWPVAGAPQVRFEIQIDDLLSHFVECWQPLALRQTYPIPVGVDRPSRLRAEAEKRWEQQPPELAEREDEIVCNFEDVHDISKCFAGYFDLAPLWLMRRGEKLIVDTRDGMKSVDFASAWTEISRLGDEIAARLEHSGHRWHLLVHSWRARDSHDALSLLAWSTSLGRAAAARLVNDGYLSAPKSFAEATNDNDELRIAARMASALPADQIRSILEIVKSFPKVAAPKLVELSKDLSAYIESRFARRRAHEQGEIAARYVRETLGLSAADRFDTFDFLLRCGVEVNFRSVEPPTLRALAVSGDRHGPAIFINGKGRPSQSEENPIFNWSSRVDMAHELCHLLLDGGHALGAVEILNSKMPVALEQRAKSFAGELLLPTEAASSEWQSARSPKSLGELNTLIFALRGKYGVTKSVARWKLQHATQALGEDISVLLETILPAQ